MICELHFQDGFAGEVVEVAVDGDLRMRRELRTRLQISLAHIEEIEVQPGQEIVVTVPARRLSKGIEAKATDRWFTVDVEGDELVLKRAEVLPGHR